MGGSGEPHVEDGRDDSLDRPLQDCSAVYEPPRLVFHIDDSAIAALTGLYRKVLPAGGRLLDLMSSWVSHLPPEVQYAEVIGHGMNAAELAANPRLSSWFVQNLNRDTQLPLAALDGSSDAEIYFPLSDLRALQIINDSSHPTKGDHLSIGKVEFWAGE